jgi:hypothetical protein
LQVSGKPLNSQGPNHRADASEKGLGVELCPQDLVRTVGENGDTPVAYEGDKLAGMRRADQGAERLGLVNSGLTFYVNQDEIVWPSLKEGEAFEMIETGVYLEVGETKDLVSKRTKHLAATDVKDRWFRRLRLIHGVSNSLVVEIL